MKHINNIIIYLLTAFACLSCVTPMDSDLVINTRPGTHGQFGGTRVEGAETRNVLLLYSAGFTTILPPYLREDIEDLMNGWLPENLRGENVLLVYSHLPETNYDLKTPTSPVLFRLYSDPNGNPVADTLVTYAPGTISASAIQMNKVLNYVKDEFPAKGYGMIFSSHGTGYLPAGYYNNSSSNIFGLAPKRRPGLSHPTPVPYVESDFDPSMPDVKSIGADISYSGSSQMSNEMEIGEFADAIPMKLDYLLFDACLMGGVEIAYELQDKCGLVGFSQTEVLAEGFDYTSLITHLLGTDTPDPISVCDDFFQQYDRLSGIMRSATISVVNTSRMSDLIQTCRNLFTKYRDGLDKTDPSLVQRYFRSDRHWFYDLESIIYEAARESGADPEALNEDIQALRNALAKCISYKASTPSFMLEFKISTYSGLSMYLPCNGSKYLDEYYKGLKWNEDTGLVQ